MRELESVSDEGRIKNKEGLVTRGVHAIKKTVLSVADRPENEDNPVRELLHGSFDALDKILALEKRAFDLSVLPVTASANAVANLLPEKIAGLSRKVFLRLTFLTLFFAEFIRANLPVEQPQVSAPALTYYKGPGEYGMSPGMPAKDALAQVSSIESFIEYLEQICEFGLPENAAEFVITYKMPSDSLKESGKSCCNGYASIGGECLAYHGMTGYKVTLCPKDMERITKDGWHQILVICVIHGKRYVVLDSGTAYVHEGSLQSLIDKEYPTMKIIPNGVQEWRRLRHHPFATFGSHVLYPSVSESQMTAYPQLVPDGEQFAVLPQRRSNKEATVGTLNHIFSALLSKK